MSVSTAPVSVLMPCLNAENTLAQAINSALNQSARPLEILVIDDGSSDRSVDIARQFGSPVRILRNPQHGPGAARRFGVNEAKGTFIAHLDADDTIAPTMYEKQLTRLESNPPHTFVHTDALLTYTDGSQSTRRRRRGHIATGQCTQAVFETNPICGASTMLRRSVILELGNYESALLGAEDYHMSLKASTCCEFVYVDEPLYHITRHASNVTRRTSMMAYMHWMAQSLFRDEYPQAFAELSDACIKQYMTDPVLAATRCAYWQRDACDYKPLLKLAASIAPDEPDIQTFKRRQHLPLRLLKWIDGLRSSGRTPVAETP